MKHYLTQHFLPAWARETVLRDNERLQRKLDCLQAENRCLQAYIRGMRVCLRQQRHGTQKEEA